MGEAPIGTLGSVCGVLLAGGRARRMGGGDKCLRPLGGRPLIAHVIERTRSQVQTQIICANGDLARFARFGLPVVEDTIGDFAGPLVGILSGMEWAAAALPGARWIASFATDTPFLPDDLVARLGAAVEEEGAEMACATSGGRTHPIIGLWPVEAAAEIRRAISEEKLRKALMWVQRRRTALVDFPCRPHDPFFNVNRERDLEEAERLLGG